MAVKGLTTPLLRWLRVLCLFVQVRGTFEEPPTGLIPWFSKTEGNTYATISFDNSQKRAFDLILFALDWYTNLSRFPNLLELFELQKYSRVSDYYRLFCF